MRKILVILVFVGMMMASCSHRPETIIVRGELNGVPDSAKVSVLLDMGQLLKEVVRGDVIDGKFEIEMSLDSLRKEREDITLPVKMVLLGTEAPVIYGLQRFYAVAGVNEVRGEGNIYEWRIENKGTKQKQLNAFNDALPEEVVAWNNELNKEYEFNIHNREYNESTHLYDRMDEAANALSNARLDVLSDTKKLSDVHLDILNKIVLSGLKYDDFMEPRRAEIEQVFAAFSPELKESDLGREVSVMINPPELVGVGKEIPSDIELFDTEGNNHTMAEFKGRYVLMDFWSTGCGPCIMAGPELKELSENYPDQLAVVSISIDPEYLWKQASVDHNITWNNFSDYQGRNMGFCSHFGFDGIPYFLVVNPEGVVVKEGMGYGKGVLKALVSEYINM